MPGNPVAALAKQSRTRMHAIIHSCRLYTADGEPVPEALDEAMEQEWNTTHCSLGTTQHSLLLTTTHCSLRTTRHPLLLTTTHC